MDFDVAEGEILKIASPQTTSDQRKKNKQTDNGNIFSLNNYRSFMPN